MKRLTQHAFFGILLSAFLPFLSLQAQLSTGIGRTTHSDHVLAHSAGYEQPDGGRETSDSIDLSFNDGNGHDISGTFTPALDENGNPCYQYEGGIQSGVEAGKNIYAKQGSDGSWSVSFDGKAYANVGVTVKADSSETSIKVGGEAGASVDGDVGGRLGNDRNNLHGTAHGTLDAKAKAGVVAALMYDKELGAKVAAEVGAALTANGSVSGGFTLGGIPVDVELFGSADFGAKAVAEGSITFNKETGKFEVYTKLGASVGVGLEGGVKVSIGVGQIIDFIMQAGGDIADKLNKLLDNVMDSLKGFLNDPFADDPATENQTEESGKRFEGLKPMRLHR